MQRLSRRRTTDTPRDIPHVPGNCGLSFNSPEGRGSVAGLTTLDNDPDAALTPPRREKEDFLLVFVRNRHGKALMPCHAAKARQLLKAGRARVVKRTPFVIQLRYGSSGYRQPISLGVDPGYGGVGLSAVGEKQELYVSEVALRTDMVKLNAERSQYRRFRRYRKTGYRQPRFLNRKKPEGWLPPSIRNKLETHLKVIDQVKQMLPVSCMTVEVAGFDIQKIKNAAISGVGNQNGSQKDFWNVREYVLYRDNHRCQHCKGKTADPVLEVHHRTSRQTGGDRPDNLITLCRTCHEKVSQGQLVLGGTPSQGFKAETFMTTVRWKLVEELRGRGNEVSPTFGYLTKCGRLSLGLSKSHRNDAFVIAGGQNQKRQDTGYAVQQVRKGNRKLFKGDRSHRKNTAPRYLHGFQRYDKVRWSGIDCFIFGRRTTGYFALRTLTGEKICASAKASSLTLLESAKTLLTERRRSGSSLWQDHRVSAA